MSVLLSQFILLSKLYFKSKKKIPVGEFVEVKINEALDYDLVGENINN